MKGSHVFTTLGHRSYRRRTVILVGSALVIVVIAIVGLSVFPRLGSEGFNDPASDSEQVAQILEEQFGSPESNMFSRWLIRNRIARIRSIPRRQREWGALSRRLWRPCPATSSRQIADAVERTVVEQSLGSGAVYMGGGAAIAKAINTRISTNLERAEAIAIPVTFVLLLFVFGGIIAAGMPLLVGVGSIVGSLFGLFFVRPVPCYLRD